jgi:hypothetical protein
VLLKHFKAFGDLLLVAVYNLPNKGRLLISLSTLKELVDNPVAHL